MRSIFALALSVVAVLTTTSASLVAAEPHVIRVVSDAETGQPRFDPPILFIEPGESVHISMAGKVFASRLIAGMHPPDAEIWWGQVGESVDVSLTEPGVYGHKCGASYGLGLVGLIVVGDPSVNLDAAKAVQHPPMAARVFRDLFASLPSGKSG